MKTSQNLLFVIFLSSTVIAGMRSAFAQVDDFNDGDATGWTEIVPLTVVGGTGSFTFPDDNSYRLQSGASPDEGAFGPSRIGSLREDVSYTDFYQFVDIIDYDQGLDQNIGMLARVRQPGLQMLDGYAVTYNPTDQAIFLSVITDEANDNIGTAEALVDVGAPVRLVFQGQGDSLKFEVFLLTDLNNAVASIEVTDSTYTAGNSGVFVATDLGDPAFPTDSTFDNYFAAASEPVGFELLSIAIADDMIVFEFLSQPGKGYSLWESDDLKAWSEIDDSIVGALGTTTTYPLTKPALLRNYYQFRPR